MFAFERTLWITVCLILGPVPAFAGRIPTSRDSRDHEPIAHPLRVLSGHADAVWAVAFSPDSRQAISGSYDGTVGLWEVESGKAIGLLKGHTAGILSVAYSTDGHVAVSGGADRTIRVWDLPQ